MRNCRRQLIEEQHIHYFLRSQNELSTISTVQNIYNNFYKILGLYSIAHLKLQKTIRKKYITAFHFSHPQQKTRLGSRSTFSGLSLILLVCFSGSLFKLKFLLLESSPVLEPCGRPPFEEHTIFGRK